MENFRAVFYAPYYAAYALGLFAEEGVDVELVTSDTPGDAVPRLLTDQIDLTWGGPMRIMSAHDRDALSPLVCFGEVVSRDPFFLIGRQDTSKETFKQTFKETFEEPFDLRDLRHLRFASVAEVPTPWMCLQQDLRDVGVDPDDVARGAGRTMAENYAALSRGELDVMQAFEPFASMAEQSQTGKILYSASNRGPTVYTAFIATRAGIERHGDAFAAMTRAIAKLEDWVYREGPLQLADAAQTFFPDVPLDLLSRSLQRYWDAGLWARHPAMSRAGFDRLGKSFHSGGALSRLPTFEDCVDGNLGNGAKDR
jgi:NitT/TauT family transport system substrate-binding protein